MIGLSRQDNLFLLWWCSSLATPILQPSEGSSLAQFNAGYPT